MRSRNMMNTFKVGLLALTITLLAVFSLNGEYSPVVVIVFRLQITSRIAINILKILAAMESSRKAYLVKMLITMQKAKKI